MVAYMNYLTTNKVPYVDSMSDNPSKIRRLEAKKWRENSDNIGYVLLVSEDFYSTLDEYLNKLTLKDLDMMRKDVIILSKDTTIVNSVDELRKAVVLNKIKRGKNTYTTYCL